LRECSLVNRLGGYLRIAGLVDDVADHAVENGQRL
jgi:hypothetical protein